MSIPVSALDHPFIPVAQTRPIFRLSTPPQEQCTVLCYLNPVILLVDLEDGAVFWLFCFSLSQAGVVFLDIESADFSVILPLPQCCRRLLMNLLQPGIIESVSTPLPHRQWIFTWCLGDRNWVRYSPHPTVDAVPIYQVCSMMQVFSGL